MAAEGQISVERTVTVAGDSGRVWERIGRFGDMSWHPAIHATENPGGNAIDAVRVLTVGEAGGPTITEELADRSDQGRRYAYRIVAVDPAVLPVTNCASELAVAAGGDGGTVVSWRGQFDAAGADDAAAEAAIAGVYEAGLDAIKQAFETA